MDELSECIVCWTASLSWEVWLTACKREMLLSKSVGLVCVALLGVLHEIFTMMGCFLNMALSKWKHSLNFPYCLTMTALFHCVSHPCKTNLFVHDELHLPSPKFAMCFRSSVLLSCNSGFPVTIWKYRGISAVWNSSRQTLFRQLMIPQPLSVPVSSSSCEQLFSSSLWMLILILLWFTFFVGN